MTTPHNTAQKPYRFEKLTDEQLLGAHYALRLIRTSPRIRGAALEMLDDQLEDCERVMAERQPRAATLRAKIEALPTWERLKFSGAEDRGADQFKRDVLAVLDAVLGGDS